MYASQSLPVSAHELQESVRQRQPLAQSRLDRILGFDARRALLEVQANTSWRAVAERLRPGDERAQRLLSGRATVGGTISWNAAGPDGRPAVMHVESLTMVTPDGHLKRVDRLVNGALFALTVGGQGLFGVIYSVTLRVESLLRTLAEAQTPESLAACRSPAASRKLRILVPPEKLDGFVDEARARCIEWRAQLEAVLVRRTRSEQETYLRWAHREYAEVVLRLCAGPTIGSAVRYNQLCRELIDAAIARGGTFPIACTPEATRAQTESCYPRLASFLAEQRRIDPGGLLANEWSRHQRSLLGRQPCDVRWGR